MQESNSVLLRFPWTVPEFLAASKADVLWRAYSILKNGHPRLDHFVDRFCFNQLQALGLLWNVDPQELLQVCGLADQLAASKVALHTVPPMAPSLQALNCTSRMPFLMATLWSWAGLMLRSTSPLGAVCVSQLPLTAQLRAKCDCSSRSWLMNLIQIRCSKRLGSCLVCAVFSHLFAAVSLPSLHCGFCAAGWQCGPFSGCHCADHVWGPHVAHTHRPHCNNCLGCCECAWFACRLRACHGGARD